MNSARISTLLLVGLMSVGGSASGHDRYRDEGPGYGGNFYGGRYAPAPQRFRCESKSSRTAYCRADTRYGVRLVGQRSHSACIPGRTWGWDRGGVWVSNGCRGEFVAGGYGGDRDWRDRDRYRDDDDRGHGYGYDRGYGYGDRAGYVQSITCESQDGHYNFCLGRGFRDVRIRRQLSKAACRYNETWGFRGDGIWVDRGCRAEFTVY